MAEIALMRGDITTVHVDVIVNAANAGLRGGGGVDGAIHAAGGPVIMEACRTLMRQRALLKPGEVVATTAGELPAKFVFHAVGPVYDDASRAEVAVQLARCYREALALAEEMQLKSIAFPNISTGVYGYPKPEAAAIATETVRSFIAAGTELQKICYVCFDLENYEIYRNLLA
ncbi:MAG: O-acetyl-ADP-ribose deacetylase [Saprospiraceae bacterium]|nr:O-acetyl-ADP-ribose deacetylase [Saprospiraceae bacterium]